jgi:hypothetical protein
MPTPSAITLSDNPSLKEVVDYVIKLQRDYEWLLQNLDDINVRRLRADVLIAGTIDANVVTIRSDLTGGAYVQIDGNGMRVNNGSYNTFTADINGAVTMTSAKIQSKNGSYPLLVMDPATNLFGAYSAVDTNIHIDPNYPLTLKPAIVFEDGAFEMGTLSASSSRFILSGLQRLDLIAIAGRVTISSDNGSGVYFDDWDQIINASSGLSLQDALDAKVNV